MTSEFATGWRVLLASFIGIAIGVSSLYFYSLGIFIRPMQDAFAWTRAEASLGALVGTACAALMSVPTGWLTDRIGSVRVAIGSLLLLATGFAALSLGTHGLASFLVITALLSLLTAGSSPLPFTRLLIGAFERNRGVALGVALCGTAIGAILIPRFLTPFVAEAGWRNGYLALAAIILALTPVVALLLRGSREQSAPARHNDSPPMRVLSGSAFYLLAPMFFLAAMAVLGTVVHFVPMLSDAGVSPAQAGATASLIGFAAIAGRLFTGFLLDRLPAKWIAAVLFVISGAGLVVLAYGGVQAAPIGAIVAGFAIGSEVDLLAFLVSRHFSRAVYGRAYGAIYATFLIGGAAGPYVSGQIFDRYQSYSNWLLAAAGLLACAAFFASILPRPQVPART